MSVGHVARLVEEAGIATVVIAVNAFENRLRKMAVPRVLITPFLMGRPLGKPGDYNTQQAIVTKAVTLLEAAEKGGTVVQF